MRPVRARKILERDFGFVPARRDGGDGGDGLDDEVSGLVRINPDTDVLRWAKKDPGGGLRLLPVPVFVKGKGFRDVELMHGEPGILQLPGEHPKEVMAYAWQGWARRG